MDLATDDEDLPQRVTTHSDAAAVSVRRTGKGNALSCPRDGESELKASPEVNWGGNSQSGIFKAPPFKHPDMERSGGCRTP